MNSEFLDTKFIDNHRKIKINSLYTILFDNEKSIKPLKEIERILNENIYIDEAVGLYIYGKINSIYNIK